MPDSAEHTKLKQELEDLLHATRAMTKMLNSQSWQIDGMLQVFEILLAEPEILKTRRDVVEKLVASCRNHEPGQSAVPIHFGMN